MNEKTSPYMRLLKLSREEWPILFKGMVFLAISSMAIMLYPQYIKKIIDQALETKDSSSLNMAAFMALFVFIIQGITSSLRYYYFTLAGEKTVKRLRTKLFSQIIYQEMPFFDSTKTGELLSRLSADTAVLQNALSVNISMLIRNFVQALGGLIFLFFTSAKLTLFILVLIPPLAFLAARFGKKVKNISRSAQNALAESHSVAEESLSGVRTVKAFAQEAWEIQRYQGRIEKSYNLSLVKIFEIAKFTGLVSSLGFAAITFIIWYGGKLVISNEMTVGTLTSYLLYVITVAFSVGMLGGLYTDFMSAFGAGDRLFELLDKIPANKNNTPASDLSIKDGLIEFRNAEFSYPMRPEIQIIKKLNLILKPRETVAIVGSSGSGKTTIAGLLMRFYDLDAGHLFIDGEDIKKYNIFQLRSEIGLVSQEPILISESIEDNIRYSRPEASLDEVISAAKLAHAHSFIEDFPEKYKTLVGEKGVQLSGGQKQRVAIARAILKNPKILILDEATSALDSESEFLVQEALENLMKSKTTLVIAHRLSTIKKADRILVLNQGHVVQMGTHEELMRDQQGFYNKLLEKQFEH